MGPPLALTTREGIVMKKIFIFDMDDTTVDSSMRFDEGIFTILRDEGIPYDHDEMVATTIPLGVSGTARLFHDLGIVGTVEEIQTRIEETMAYMYKTRVHCKAGASEFLHGLSAKGHRLFTLTATSHVLADVALKENRLYDLFEKVWCTDDFGLQKHDPALCVEVARVLDASPEDIYYFDDSLTAIESARAVGFHTYGVDKGQPQEEIDYIKAHHDGFITHFSEFPI